MTVWFNPADNSLHDDMGGEALSLPIWPQGMVIATDEQIAEAQKIDPAVIKEGVDATIKAKLIEATALIGPLADLETLGEMSDSEKKYLTNLRKYRIDVSRVNQQAGYPTDVVWPELPEA